MLPSLGTHFACGSECRATGALPPNVIGKSSPTTPPSWRARGGQPPAGAPAYILRRLMLDRMTVSAVAREPGLSWDTVNTIAIDATQTIVAADTHRLDGVRVTAGPTPTATAPTGSSRAIDLTPVHDGTGRARLLDLVPGRSAAALATWLAAQTAT